MGSTRVDSGSPKLVGHVQAKFDKISSQNKIISHNKVLLIDGLRQKWDKVYGRIQVGSTELELKT